MISFRPILLAVMFAISGNHSVAHQDHSGHSGHGQDAGSSIESNEIEPADHARAREYFTDTLVQTHDGRALRFYSDLLEGKTVVVSFMFTECPDACPMINQQLKKVQDRVVDRLGEDILILSISVDPVNDTPEVLSTYRRGFGAEDGWIFVTGTEQAMETIGARMGQVFEREQHLTSLLIGNTVTGRWRKVPAHLPDNVIAAQLIDIADERPS